MTSRGSSSGPRGILSSFLDNAPTYMTMAATAAAWKDVTAGRDSICASFWPTAGDAAALLAAISCGAVFMGANTYIGNGPNFMVKAIAEENGVKMPSFFGYMAYSGAVLIPIFRAAVTVAMVAFGRLGDDHAATAHIKKPPKQAASKGGDGHCRFRERLDGQRHILVTPGRTQPQRRSQKQPPASMPAPASGGPQIASLDAVQVRTQPRGCTVRSPSGRGAAQRGEEDRPRPKTGQGGIWPRNSES